MFATRIFANPTAKVLVLLQVVVFSANGFTAQAATPTGNGWQPTGGSSTHSSAVSSSSQDAWRLPNGQVVPAAPSAKQATTSNPLRADRPATTTLREPRTMNAPANAKPIASAQRSAAAQQSKTAQKHSPSSA